MKSTPQTTSLHRTLPIGLLGRYKVLVRALLVTLLLASAGVGVHWIHTKLIQHANGHFERTPREVAQHILWRTSDHNALIVWAGRTVHDALMRIDRGPNRLDELEVPDFRPTQPVFGQSISNVNAISVGSSAELTRAIQKAIAGHTIHLLPGRYVVSQPLATYQAGRQGEPITVRGQADGSAIIRVTGGNGFQISHPHWILEDLVIEGACSHDDYCEHAVHVVGAAQKTTIRRNVIRDFSSHIKVNGHQGQQPDSGELAWNHLYNTRSRDTIKPTNVLDIVGASRWHVHHNLVTDFSNTDSRRTSFGLYAKGGAIDTLIEYNTVICERRLRGHSGARVGLSFGGGGTGPEFCRGSTRCASGEHERGVMRHNLVMACSDAGIYLNRSVDAVLEHNTLIDTGGLQARFIETQTRLSHNIIDGPVSLRDGAFAVVESNNRYDPWWLRFLGFHPQRPTDMSALIPSIPGSENRRGI